MDFLFRRSSPYQSRAYTVILTFLFRQADAAGPHSHSNEYAYYLQPVVLKLIFHHALFTYTCNINIYKLIFAADILDILNDNWSFEFLHKVCSASDELTFLQILNTNHKIVRILIPVDPLTWP